MAIRAVTFDFWRTLFLTTHERERHRLRVKALEDCTGVPADEAKRVMKQVMSDFLKTHIFEQRTLTPEDAIPMIEGELKMAITSAAASTLIDAFGDAILQCPPEPISGALEAVRSASRHVPVGLISDTGISPGTSLEKLLGRFGFLEHFSGLTFSDRVGAAKPQRAPFEDAARKLDVKPSELLHIGDLEPTDVRGAIDCGAVAALFAGDNDKYADNTNAHHVFRSWQEFTGQLPGLLG